MEQIKNKRFSDVVLKEGQRNIIIPLKNTCNG
jgi:hypothetical protein